MGLQSHSPPRVPIFSWSLIRAAHLNERHSCGIRTSSSSGRACFRLQGSVAGSFASRRDATTFGFRTGLHLEEAGGYPTKVSCPDAETPSKKKQCAHEAMHAGWG